MNLKEITHTPPGQNNPLSFQQEGIWFMCQLMPESPVWNLINCRRLKGQLHTGIFNRAVEDLVNRHPALRTRVVIIDNKPYQRYASSDEKVVRFIDLSEVDAASRELQVQALIDAEVRCPIPLGDQRLFHLLLIRLSAEEHIFLLNIHHFISDHITIYIFLCDFKNIYNSYFKDTPPLKALPIEYHDYVLWQRRVFGEQYAGEQERYWLDQFQGDLPILNLPTVFAPKFKRSFKGAVEKLNLDADLVKQLNALSFRNKTILFSTFLAAYYVLLQKYSHQDDMIVGTVFSGRDYNKSLATMAGFFVNTLALRMDLSGDPDFETFLKRVHAKVLKAYSMPNYPFERLVQKIKPDRNRGPIPLVQTFFNVLNFLKENVSYHGMEEESRIEIERVSTQTDLTLEVCHFPDRTEIQLLYNPDIFAHDTMAQMLVHYANLLRSIVNNSKKKLSELNLLSMAERQQLLGAWNSTQKDDTAHKCIHQLFEEQVERSFEKVAVVFENETLTYGDLNMKANRLAHYLKKKGIGSDVLVGIFMERSLEMIVSIIGTLKAGGAYVPLDPTYPRERLSFMLEDSRVAVLLTQTSLIAAWPEIPDRKVFCLDRDWERIAEEQKENPVREVQPEHPAYVIYTSGSTGRPKGVAVTHQSVLALLSGFEKVAPHQAPLVGATVCAFGFDVSIWEFFSNLCFGGVLHIFPAKIISNPEQFAFYLTAHRITSAYIPPGLVLPVIEQLEKQNKPSALDRLLVGVEPIKQKTLQRYCGYIDRIRIINGYGPTETTVCATLFKFNSQEIDPERPTPIGTAVSGYSIYLVDAHFQLVPIGVAGEILIGGSGLSRGYFNHPEQTAEAFVPDPFTVEPGKRLYKTGDLARYLFDGNIEFLGRIDYQVKVRGFRIELGEIEAVLSQHSAVKENAVIVQENKSGDKRLVAYIVPARGLVPVADDLRRYLKEKLPYYMVPSAFMMLDELPLTPNGKIDRKVLPTWEEDDGIHKEDYAPPQTVTEKVLATIWAEVLSKGKISLYDNFFELGGHSLLATQVISRIHEALHVDLPVGALFDEPRVSELAKHIDRILWTKQSLQPDSILVEQEVGEL